MIQLKSPMIKTQSILCSNQKQSVFVCVNAKCKQKAFICDTLQCSCSQKKHQTCSYKRLKYFLDNIEKQRLPISSQEQKSFETLIKIYDQIINKFQQQKEQLLLFIQMYGLGQYMRHFAKTINQGHQDTINGSFTHEVYQQLQKSKNQEKYMINSQKISNYWQKQQDDINKMVKKLALYRNLSSVGFHSSIIDVEGQILLQQYLQKKIKQVQLLYRGTENRFSAEKFHQKCDGVGDTIIIVKTSSNMILGGYTPVPWQKSSQVKYSPDYTGSSFLFSLGSLNQKFPINHSKLANAIRAQENFGPMFGSGCDLFIANDCDKNNGSGVFLSTYQDLDNNFTYKSGGSGTHYFKVEEYEVFKIED